MKSNHMTVFAICLVVFMAQISALPKTAKKALAAARCDPDPELVAIREWARKTNDFKWRQLLEYVPDLLFPVLKKIIIGIAQEKSPKEIIHAIVSGKEFKKKSGSNRRQKKKEEEETASPEDE
ncbi:predicted protein [Nematostella vectensis]|uniref:Uncharacterized protein n=1 Tax=Nematostella vectensis TaxID=45351 RepID=A7SQB5_NEMVE|nr:predicted protein [Nematostella vectensis]|eukprot:XP_001626199.1 predicted protein [Nematostella vectensis]